MILFLPKFTINVTILVFEIGNSPFNGEVPCSTSSGVYISQLIRFAIAFSHVADVNTHNLLSTQKLLKQCYQYHKLSKTFLNFTMDTYVLISKLSI